MLISVLLFPETPDEPVRHPFDLTLEVRKQALAKALRIILLQAAAGTTDQCGVIVVPRPKVAAAYRPGEIGTTFDRFVYHNDLVLYSCADPNFFEQLIAAHLEHFLQVRGFALPSCDCASLLWALCCHKS